MNRGRAAITIRSLLFYAGLGALTPPFALLVIVLRPFPYGVRESVARSWCRCVLAWLRVTCGVRHRVVGRERLPEGPAVILSKHESAWETVAFRALFPAHLSWVVKRSLLRIPFYGWALKALEEIGIDRSDGREALRQLDRQGTRHLQAGRWIVLFPEGTRMAPGEVGTYAIGGARLACRAGVPVVPIALNSGDCWPCNDWRKYPGTIEVEIGPAIDTRTRSPADVNRIARAWSEPLVGIRWPRVAPPVRRSRRPNGMTANGRPRWCDIEPQASDSPRASRTELQRRSVPEWPAQNPPMDAGVEVAGRAESASN